MFASLGGKQEYFVMDAIMVQLFRDESVYFYFSKEEFLLKVVQFCVFFIVRR